MRQLTTGKYHGSEPELTQNPDFLPFLPIRNRPKADTKNSGDHLVSSTGDATSIVPESSATPQKGNVPKNNAPATVGPATTLNGSIQVSAPSRTEAVPTNPSPLFPPLPASGKPINLFPALGQSINPSPASGQQTESWPLFGPSTSRSSGSGLTNPSPAFGQPTALRSISPCPLTLPSDTTSGFAQYSTPKSPFAALGGDSNPGTGSSVIPSNPAFALREETTPSKSNQLGSSSVLTSPGVTKPMNLSTRDISVAGKSYIPKAQLAEDGELTSQSLQHESRDWRTNVLRNGLSFVQTVFI